MKKVKELQLYSTVDRTYTLGHGCRYAIWVQGCPFCCKGCVTPGSQPFSGGETVTVDELASRILNTEGIEGLTISGGEPFAQADALALLILNVRQQRDIGVIIYTGYKMVDLLHKSELDGGITELLSCADLVIDGLYIEKKNTGEPLRGSNNQQLHLLTDRYRQAMIIYGQDEARKIEIHLAGDMAMLVGIPSIQQATLWQNFKENKK